MGVQGLWTLLSPAGRKLKLEALEGHRLAVDVSIWVIRMINGFSGANRQDFKNAHLIGIFKRLCRLLSLGIKPVFVFDGKAPELKRKTLYLRQQYREKRQQNLQKLAEKYVIRQLEGRIKTNGSESAISSNQVNARSEFEDDFLDELDSANSEEMNQFEQDTNAFQEKIVNLEFQEILKQVPKYPNLLEGIVASKEEFDIFDISSKLEIVQQVNQRLSEIRSKDLSTIKNMEEFSKVQAKNYVEYISSKRAVSKERDAGYKQIAQQHEAILIEEAAKSLNPTTRDKLTQLVNSRNNGIISGTVKSDHNTTFLFMQNNSDNNNNNKSGSSNAATAAVTSKIGMVTKLVRKTKFEKGLEVQQRIAELLKHKDGFGGSLMYAREEENNNKSTASNNANNSNNNTNHSNSLNSIKKKNGSSISNFSDADDDDDDGDRDGSGDGDGFGEEIISVGGRKQKQSKAVEPLVSDSDEFNFSSGDDDDNEQANKKGRQNSDKQAQMLESQASASQAEELPEDIDEIMNQGMMEDSDSNYSQNQDLYSRVSSTKNDTIKEDTESQSVNLRGSDSFFLQSQQRMAEFLEPLKRNGYEVIRERISGESRQAAERGIVATSASNQVTQMPVVDRSNVAPIVQSTKIVEERPIRMDMQAAACAMQVEEDDEAKDEKLVIEMSVNNNRNSINRMMETLERQEKKKEGLNAGEHLASSNVAAEKEKAEFEKLITKLKAEEMIANMSKEEAAAYKRAQRKQEGRTRSLFAGSSSIEEERMSQAVGEDANYGDEDDEDDNDDDDGGVDEVEVRKLLAQVEKWEEEQNNHVNDGIDLTDEQLELEFQRFVNLSEVDSESIQTKFQQVRQLLLLFGVPWVEAPSEAEAQCAYLEQINLVEGTITDDSDVFLFGAKRVYRGLFAKDTDYVRYIDIQTIIRDLGIDRDKLISMALFLGSDYTIGIKGVGIVNAMEIVSAFESMDALHRFKLWANKADVLLEDYTQHYRNISLKEKNYKESHKNYKKNWELPDDFPSQKVVDAYQRPNVDTSNEPFQWGQPNIPLLRAYCANMFNWNPELISYVLDPLTAFLSQPPNPQKKITDYYKQAQKFAIVNSNRLKTAIDSLQKNDPSAEESKLSSAARINTLIQGIQTRTQNQEDSRKKTMSRRAAVQGDEGDEDQEDDESFTGGSSNYVTSDTINRFAFIKRGKKKQSSNPTKGRQNY